MEIPERAGDMAYLGYSRSDGSEDDECDEHLWELFYRLQINRFLPTTPDLQFGIHPAQLLMNGQKSPQEQIREIVEGMTAKTWKADKQRVLKLLGGVGVEV
jgi:hypothetical protein